MPGRFTLQTFPCPHGSRSFVETEGAPKGRALQKVTFSFHLVSLVRQLLLENQPLPHKKAPATAGFSRLQGKTLSLPILILWVVTPNLVASLLPLNKGHRECLPGVTKETKNGDIQQESKDSVTWMTTIFLPEKARCPIVSDVHGGGWTSLAVKPKERGIPIQREKRQTAVPTKLQNNSTVKVMQPAA